MPGASMAVPFNIVDMDKNGELTAAEWAGLLAFAAQASVEHGLLAIKPGGRGDVTDTHVVSERIARFRRCRRRCLPGPRLLRAQRRDPHLPRYRHGRVVTGPGLLRPVDTSRRRSPRRPGVSRPRRGLADGVRPRDELKAPARNDLGEALYPTPAASPEVLYARTPSALYAFASR